MILLCLMLIPLAGAALLAACPLRRGPSAGAMAAFWSLVPLALVAALGARNAASPGGVMASWSLPWLPDAGITLQFAVNGTSWLFLLLTTLVTLFAIVAAIRLGQRDKAFFALILALEGMLAGVFTARHFIPWFLCWEMTLIPSYLLVRLWGGANAPRAALRFFLMTLGGSVFMLLGFLALQIATGTMDFDALAALAKNRELAPHLGAAFAATGYPGATLLTIVALSVFLGLAVKVPVVPFHAWLPDAYAEAPVPATMLLTGLLSKMGVYGLLVIFLPLFPEVLPALAPLLTFLAVATVVLGAVAALAQRDMKRILAYSSVNHLGYCALAIAALGSATAANRESASAALSGVVLQAFNHGIIAPTIFFCIGLLESRHNGKRGLGDFGGLRAPAPVLCGLMGIALFASLGLPGLSGFVGEFLIFNGVFGLTPWAAAVSVLGLLLTAVFFLRLLRMVFHGPLNLNLAGWKDLNAAERMSLAPAIALIVLPGLWPQALLHWVNLDTTRLLDLLLPIP